MPIVINEIVIRTEVQQPASATTTTPAAHQEEMLEQLLKQTVEKVLEIIEEKKQR